MGKQDGRERLATPDEVDDPRATIMHVDLDAFFASVELLEHPELRDKPVVIGHRGNRSVVSAANYPARRYGVNSAMPMAVALRRCPNAIVLEPHYERYAHFSKLVMGMFDEITPRVERISIDEAFLDVAGARGLFGSPWRIATDLRARVQRETGLTISVGIASTKYVAKVASGRSKPDGLLVVPHDDTVAFLHPMPITALWGVGAKSAEKLHEKGLRTVGDLATTPVPTLVTWIGQAGAGRLHDLAWGRDPRAVTPEHVEKSIGHEETFGVDLTDPADVHRELLLLSQKVGERLRKQGLVSRTVALKLRYPDFRTITRSRTLSEPTDVTRRLYEAARELADAAMKPGDRIRLLGVRAEQLDAPAPSIGLWDDDEQWRGTDSTIDQVRARFGSNLLGPATLLHRRAEAPKHSDRQAIREPTDGAGGDTPPRGAPGRGTASGGQRARYHSSE